MSPAQHDLQPDLKYVVSTRGAEEFYLTAGAANVCEVLTAAFRQGGNAAVAAVPAITDGQQAGSVLDELSLDDSKVYQQKTGKYIQNTLRAAEDAWFWYVMRLGHETRAPLLHFYRILNRDPAKNSMPVVALVCEDLDAVSKNFRDALLNMGKMLSRALDEIAHVPGAQEQRQQMRKDGRDVALVLLLHNASAFQRRVCNVFDRWANCERMFL